MNYQAPVKISNNCGGIYVQRAVTIHPDVKDESRQDRRKKK